MRRNLRLSPAAEGELEVVRFWYSQPGSGPRALIRRRAIVKAIRDLQHHPSRYPVGDYAGVRERSVEGRRILYSVEPDTGDDRTAGNVYILRIFGPGQARDHI